MYIYTHSTYFVYRKWKSKSCAVLFQEHWRKLTRNDLLTTDPDTPPAHIVYDVLKITLGRFILLSDPSTSSISSSSSSPPPAPSLTPASVSPVSHRIGINDLDNVKDYASTTRFSQVKMRRHISLMINYTL